MRPPGPGCSQSGQACLSPFLMRQKTYPELVVLNPESIVHLTAAEQQAIPCHFLIAQEVERRMLVMTPPRFLTWLYSDDGYVLGS